MTALESLPLPSSSFFLLKSMNFRAVHNLGSRRACRVGRGESELSAGGGGGGKATSPAAASLRCSRPSCCSPRRADVTLIVAAVAVAVAVVVAHSASSLLFLLPPALASLARPAASEPTQHGSRRPKVPPRRSGLDNLFGAVLLNDKPLEVRGVQHEADGSVVAMLGTKEKPGAIKLRLFKEETPPTASTAAHAVHSASASNQPTASYTPSTQYHFPPASLGTANMTQAHVSHYYQLQQAYRCSSITGNEYKQLVQYTSALNKFYYAPVLGPLQPYGTQVGLGSSSLHPASNQLSPSSSSAAAQPAAAQPAASSSSPLTRLSDADLHSQLQALRQIRRLAELETELERCRAEEAAEGEPGVSFLGAAASGRGVKREADEVVKHDGEEEVVAAVKVEEDQREEEEVKPARKKTKKG